MSEFREKLVYDVWKILGLTNNIVNHHQETKMAVDIQRVWIMQGIHVALPLICKKISKEFNMPISELEKVFRI